MGKTIDDAIEECKREIEHYSRKLEILKKQKGIPRIYKIDLKGGVDNGRE